MRYYTLLGFHQVRSVVIPAKNVQVVISSAHCMAETSRIQTANEPPCHGFWREVENFIRKGKAS